MFDQRIAVVTGGSQGLGRAVTERLVGQGAAGILIVGRDVAKGEAAAAAMSSADCRVVFTSQDLADPEGPDRILARCDEVFGTVHAVVNAAAMTDRGSVWDADAELWDRMLATNLRAPGLLTSAAARLMVRDGVEGSIVHVGSVAGHGGQPELLVYSASKGALVPLVRNAAFALSRHRIRVNLVQPGWMDTPAEDQIQRRYHGATDGWLDRAAAQQPFGRLIDPHELARTLAFVASPESGLMTGAVIDYDQTILGPLTSRADLRPVWGEPGGPQEGISA